MKDWLVRALAKALKDGGRTLTRKHLQKSALSISQVDKMLSEAIEGEALLDESTESRTRLRRLMGLEVKFTKSSASDNGNPNMSGLNQITSRKRRRPGERNPKRDPVGNGQRNTG